MYQLEIHAKDGKIYLENYYSRDRAILAAFREDCPCFVTEVKEVKTDG